MNFIKKIFKKMMFILILLCGFAPISGFIGPNFNISSNVANGIVFGLIFCLDIYLDIKYKYSDSQEVNSFMIRIMEICHIGILSVIILMFIRSILWRHELWLIHI